MQQKQSEMKPFLMLNERYFGYVDYQLFIRMSGFYMAAEFLLGLGLTAEMAAELEIKRQINNFLQKYQGELDLIQTLYKLIQGTFYTKPLSDQFEQVNLISAKVYGSIAKNMNDSVEQSKVIFQRYGKIRQNQKEIDWKDYVMVSVFPVFVTGIFTEYMIQQSKVKFEGFTSPKQELGIALKLGMKRQELVQAKFSVHDMQIELAKEQKAIRQNPEEFTFKQLAKDGWAYFKSNKLRTIGKTIMTGLRLTMFVFGAISFVNGIGSLKDLTKLQDNLEKQLGTGGKIQQDELAMLQIISMIVTGASNLLVEGFNLIQDFQNAYELLLVLIPSLHDRIQKDADSIRPQNYVEGFNISFIEKISKISFQLYAQYLKTKAYYQANNSADDKRTKLKDSLTAVKTSIEGIKDQYSGIIGDFTRRLQSDSIFLSYSLDTYSSQMNYYTTFISQLFVAFQSRADYIKQSKLEKQQNQEEDKKNNGQLTSAELQKIDQLIILQHILPSYIRNYVNPQYPNSPLNPVINQFSKQTLKDLQNRDKYYKQNIARYVSSFTNQFYYDSSDGKTLYSIQLSNKNGPTKKQLMEKYKQKNFPGTVPIPQGLYKQEDANALQNGSMLSVQHFKQILFDLDKSFNKKYDIIQAKRCNRISQTEGPEVYFTKVDKKGQITREAKKVNVFMYQRCLIIECQNIDEKKQWEKNINARSIEDKSPLPARPPSQIFLLTDKGERGSPRWVIQSKKILDQQRKKKEEQQKKKKEEQFKKKEAQKSTTNP